MSTLLDWVRKMADQDDSEEETAGQRPPEHVYDTPDFTRDPETGKLVRARIDYDRYEDTELPSESSSEESSSYDSDVERRRVLEQRAQQIRDKPVFIFVCGAPGAGKSTLMRALQGKLGATIFPKPNQSMIQTKELPSAGSDTNDSSTRRYEDCIDNLHELKSRDPTRYTTLYLIRDICKQVLNVGLTKASTRYILIEKSPYEQEFVDLALAQENQTISALEVDILRLVHESIRANMIKYKIYDGYQIFIHLKGDPRTFRRRLEQRRQQHESVLKQRMALRSNNSGGGEHHGSMPSHTHQQAGADAAIPPRTPNSQVIDLGSTALQQALGDRITRPIESGGGASNTPGSAANTTTAQTATNTTNASSIAIQSAASARTQGNSRLNFTAEMVEMQESIPSESVLARQCKYYDDMFNSEWGRKNTVMHLPEEQIDCADLTSEKYERVVNQIVTEIAKTHQQIVDRKLRRLFPGAYPSSRSRAPAHSTRIAVHSSTLTTTSGGGGGGGAQQLRARRVGDGGRHTALGSASDDEDGSGGGDGGSSDEGQLYTSAVPGEYDHLDSDEDIELREMRKREQRRAGEYDTDSDLEGGTLYETRSTRTNTDEYTGLEKQD